MRVSGPHAGVGAGNVLDQFTLTNLGPGACLLRGYPIVTGDPAGGRRVRLPVRRAPAGTYFGQLMSADMLARGHVFLYLATEDVTCTPRKITYRNLSFRFASGQTLHTRAHLSPVCGGWEMPRVGLPVRTAATMPPRPGSIDSLRVAITRPIRSRSGGLLSYVVTLTDPTRLPVELVPCPTYTELLNAYPLIERPAFRLNCDSVHRIAPGGRLRFRMRMTVPPHLRLLNAKFVWYLNTPAGPGATVVFG